MCSICWEFGIAVAEKHESFVSLVNFHLRQRFGSGPSESLHILVGIEIAGMSGTTPFIESRAIRPTRHCPSSVETLSTLSLNTKSSTHSSSRFRLKRVNTPPGLNLFGLMSDDELGVSGGTEKKQHKRSVSAANRTAMKDSMMNGALSAGLTMRPGTSASAMSALAMGLESIRSPCFVHKTFGGSIDLERVLDECRHEEMTHHNLLQTATGVREVARQLGMLRQEFG